MTRLVHPSPNASRVHLGKHYRPARYERRHSDGSYEAFMPGDRVSLSETAPPITGATLALSTAAVALLGTVVLLLT